VTSRVTRSHFTGAILVTKTIAVDVESLVRPAGTAGGVRGGRAGVVADGRPRESAVGEREVRWPVWAKPLPSRWMRYRIVDVFSDRPLAGNALCVVVDECPEELMAAIAAK
jgi:hypothetical protein